MKRPQSAVLRELLSTVPPPRQERERRSRRAQPEATRRFSATLPAGLISRFRGLCESQGLPPRAVIEQLVQSYVARHEDPRRQRPRAH